jgi:hypothetical protein
LNKINSADLGAKFYLNGFPKAGLHLLAQLIKPIAREMPRDQFDAPWVNTFQGNSYVLDRVPLGQTTFGIGRTREGYFTKGHSCYDPDLDSFMNFLGIMHIFVYRDLRDVAVSQAFHIMFADNEHLLHPDPELYMKLGGFDKVLSAVIEGIEEYPGVMERWDLYAPWLAPEWVLKMPFERMLNHTKNSAFRIMQYMIVRMASIKSSEAVVDTEIAEHTMNLMVRSSDRTHHSPTFREGKTGSWRKHFTQKHVEQFKKTDSGWLVQLGYETDDNWGLQQE